MNEPKTAEPKLGYTFTPEVRQIYSRLIHLAAELARADCVPDAESVVLHKSTTIGDWGRVVRALDDIDDRLKFYALELRKVADSLPKTEPVRLQV